MIARIAGKRGTFRINPGKRAELGRVEPHHPG
jgi:hypothetical protein